MISVIICTYNRDKYLGETLQRLAANQYKGAWEIVLVNNNSTDTTEDICNRLIHISKFLHPFAILCNIPK